MHQLWWNLAQRVDNESGIMTPETVKVKNREGHTQTPAQQSTKQPTEEHGRMKTG